MQTSRAQQLRLRVVQYIVLHTLYRHSAAGRSYAHLLAVQWLQHSVSRWLPVARNQERFRNGGRALGRQHGKQIRHTAAYLEHLQAFSSQTANTISVACSK